MSVIQTVGRVSQKPTSLIRCSTGKGGQRTCARILLSRGSNLDEHPKLQIVEASIFVEALRQHPLGRFCLPRDFIFTITNWLPVDAIIHSNRADR